MKRKIFLSSNILLAVLLTLGLTISFRSLMAWSTPLGTAPNNNISAPLNGGATAQIKSGDLTVNGNFTAGGSLSGNLLVIGNSGATIMGNTGIGTISPTEKLEVNGNVKATAFYYSSDARLKTGINPLTGSLEKIMSLEGKTFRWKDSGQPSIGLIAQDTEKVYPELVNTDPRTGLKSIEYGNLVAPLIEAVKEQQRQIEDLRAQIKELKNN